ncbi:MAG: phosphatidylinositol mannoside acyltransferase [Euzebyales bacterium]|nr:phosphatidylinositol mannoside acyltransferase [Euzebyales bacterium]
MSPPTYRGSGHPGAPVDRRPGALERIPADPRPEGVRLRAIAVLWHAMWETLRRLPAGLAFAIGDRAALLGYWTARRSRRQVRANLRRVVGPRADLEEAVRAAFRSYARYWIEAFRAADLDPDDLDARTTTDGFAHLDAALEQGKGAIVLLAHHGSWDVAARWAECHGYHLAVVAEVVRPRSLFAKFLRLREAVGLEVVPLEPRRRTAEPGAAAGGRGAGMGGRLTEVLAANHLVGLLTDRDLSGRAPIAMLFGEPCRIPTGAIVLARRSGAPIVPITMLQRPGRRWHLQVLPALDVATGTISEACGTIAGALEGLIRTDPAQWHAFSSVWLADRRAAAQAVDRSLAAQTAEGP